MMIYMLHSLPGFPWLGPWTVCAVLINHCLDDNQTMQKEFEGVSELQEDEVMCWVGYVTVSLYGRE